MENTSAPAVSKAGSRDLLGNTLRIAIIVLVICLFVPVLNPVRMSGLISSNASFFTSGISYSGLVEGFGRALKKGWIEESVLVMTYIGSLIGCLGTAAAGIGCAMTLGEIRLKRLGTKISLGGCIADLAGVIFMAAQYPAYENSANVGKIKPEFPAGAYVFIGLYILCAVLCIVYLLKTPKAAKGTKFAMASKYQLFLLMLPFIVLIFLFSYLPLWGWRYGFFDYTPGSELTMDKFVGFKWFTYLFENSATRSDILRVLRNTLAMSGLGLLTSWLPMAFAIFLSEIHNNHVRRVTQTVTTMTIINWLSTPEGTMVMKYGPQGVCWDYNESGKAYLTDLGLKSINDAEGTSMEGTGYIGNFDDGKCKINNTTWSIDAINPVTGESYNYLMWESYNNDLVPAQIFSEWREWAGAQTADEYLEDNGHIAVKIRTTFSDATKDADLTTIWGQVQECIKTYSWNAIYAKSDAEYDSIVSEMITKANEYGYQQCVEFQQGEAAKRKALEDAVK